MISRIEWKCLNKFSSQFSSWISLIIIAGIGWECPSFQDNSHLESCRISSQELGENVVVFRLILTLNLFNYHWIPYSSWNLIIVITWLVSFVKQKSYRAWLMGLYPISIPNFSIKLKIYNQMILLFWFSALLHIKKIIIK